MTQKCAIIAGGSGFIAFNLIEKLLTKDNVDIISIDKSKNPIPKYFTSSNEKKYFKYYSADLAEYQECKNTFEKIQCDNKNKQIEVWHLAANSDISKGITDLTVDLNDTFMTTVNIIRCMDEFKLKVLNFSSSSAVYGDFGEQKLHESLGPLMPISNYGAMKMASEALICAAGENFLEKANIFRFPNVVGTPATHGVIYDFIKKLKNDRDNLNVLGNGSQQKIYLHVKELISAMLLISETQTKNKIEIINIGPEDSGVTVKWIAEEVVQSINQNANIVYGKTPQGWIGDVPKFKYNIDKLKSYGYKVTMDSKTSVLKAISEIIKQVM